MNSAKKSITHHNLCPFIKVFKRLIFSHFSIPVRVSRPKEADISHHYSKKYGTLVCIVPNIALSLCRQIEIKMKSVFSNTIIQVLLMLFFTTGTIHAQQHEKVVSSPDLYNEIKKQDSLLFAAFNARDINTFKNYFSEDLEFFHDTGGLTDYNHTINFLKTTTEQNNGLKRELVKESLQVYPIPGYGAMEIGSHQFCHIENGKNDCGIFKFVQIWQKKEGQWKVTRVVSYGH